MFQIPNVYKQGFNLELWGQVNWRTMTGTIEVIEDSPDSKQAGGAQLGAASNMALEALLVLCPSPRIVLMCVETNYTLI